MQDKSLEIEFDANPFYLDSVEPDLDTTTLEYNRRGEDVYADGRQVLVRSCLDGLISYPNEKEERGILLIKRKGEPAQGYLWPLGGFIDRGHLTAESLASRINSESGLEIEIGSLKLLGFINALWNKTPNPNAVAKGLPLGIHDTGLLFYAIGHGDLNLDKLHEKPTIITPKEYTSEFKDKLHPYVRLGMDRAIKFL